MICGSCRIRRWRAANPIKYAFANLRDNARRRGVPFMLTLEQFTQFCYKTDYIAGKGRTSESYSIDRIDNDKGYMPDNIRMITFGENSSKKNKKLSYDYQTGFATVISVPNESRQEPGPF